MHIELPEKKLFTIGEVAKLFNVNTSLIRYWEKEFNNLHPRKNNKGSRKYSPEDIDQIKLIYYLVKEKEYTINGAKKYIKEKHKEKISNYELINKLKKIKSQLIKLSEQLGA